MNEKEKFIAGGIFRNRQGWMDLLERAENRGMFIPESVREAIITGELNLLHKEVYAEKKTKVIFNNEHTNFDSLCRKYNETENPNYTGVTKYEKQFKMLYEKYLDEGILRWAEEYEIPYIQINSSNK